MNPAISRNALFWFFIPLLATIAAGPQSLGAQQIQPDGVPRSQLCGTTPEEFDRRSPQIPQDWLWVCYCFSHPTAACHGGEPKEAPVLASPRIIAADAIFGTNLVLNGGAEIGPASPSGDKVDTVPGWTTTGNFAVVQYGAGGSASADVRPDDPGPPDRGKNFFAGGPFNESSSAVQTIDVSAGGSAIDRGEVVFNLEGYLGGWRDQNDNATLTATFGDVDGVVLGQVTLGPVTATDRNKETGLLPTSQIGVLPKGTRKIRIELRMSRTDGNYNDGYADNVSLKLDRVGFLQSVFQQTKIRLDLDKPSATPGQSIPFRVNLVNSDNIPTFAERNVPIDFRIKGDAQVSPGHVTIPKGANSAAATIRSSNCGRSVATASSPGLGEAQEAFAYCCPGTVQRLQFSSGDEKRIRADGITRSSFTIQLIGADGTPISDGDPKQIGLNNDGVGKAVSRDRWVREGFLPADQCEKRYDISSDVPGVATITASMGLLSSPTMRFEFYLPLSILLLAFVIAGGVAGAFVRAAVTWTKSKRWAPGRWAAFLSSGALIGLCVFLAYYYGIASAVAGLAPIPGRGEGFGFLLGMLGGYLGPPAMDRIAGRIIPLPKDGARNA